MKARTVVLLVLVHVGLLTLVACDTRTPTQPPPPVQVSAPATLSGVWRGLFEITHCAGQLGDCDGRAINEFQLTMVPSGDGLEGVLILLDDERTTVNVAAQTVNGAYRFSAAGFEAITTATWPVRTVVTTIELRADPVAGLTGSMTYTNTTFRSFSRTIAIRSAVQQPQAERPGRFHGTWLGYYQTLSCTGDCRIGAGGYNNPEGGHLSLALSQAGTDLVGVVMSQLISGTAQPTLLSATGTALTQAPCQVCWDCSGICQEAVRDLSATIDKLGRLTGTFEYSRKGVSGSLQFRQTMRVALVSVTRRW